MTDAHIRAMIARDIGILADPDVEISMQTTDDPGRYRMVLCRRRGASNEPDFRFRDPDRA